MLPALPTGIASAAGRLAELLDHLERRGLLALDPVRVDRVDELDRVLLRELADERERVVEVAADGDHARAVHQRLRELADRDLALGHDHGAAHPGPRGVGGGAGRRVAGRGADHGLGPPPRGPRDRDGHPPVLERARRVRAFELQEDPRADALGDHGRLDERRRALVEGHDGVAVLQRQVLAVALDQRRGHAPRTLRAQRACGSRRRSRRAARPARTRSSRGARRCARLAAISSWVKSRTSLSAELVRPSHGESRSARPSPSPLDAGSTATLSTQRWSSSATKQDHARGAHPSSASTHPSNSARTHRVVVVHRPRAPADDRHPLLVRAVDQLRTAGRVLDGRPA